MHTYKYIYAYAHIYICDSTYRHSKLKGPECERSGTEKEPERRHRNEGNGTKEPPKNQNEATVTKEPERRNRTIRKPGKENNDFGNQIQTTSRWVAFVCHTKVED